MLRDQVIQTLSANIDELRHQYGVQTLAIFGSIARGQEREDSDIDLLVSFEQTPSLLVFIRLKEHLEALLSRKVDLVTPGALKPQLRDRILKEAVRAA